VGNRPDQSTGASGWPIKVCATSVPTKESQTTKGEAPGGGRKEEKALTLSPRLGQGRSWGLSLRNTKEGGTSQQSFQKTTITIHKRGQGIPTAFDFRLPRKGNPVATATALSGWSAKCRWCQGGTFLGQKKQNKG